MKNKLQLKNLLSKHYIRTALIPIFIIEILLLLLYFSINIYISKTNTELLQNEVIEYSKKILSKESEYIDNKLSEVATMSKMLQKEHELFFLNPDAFGFPAGTPSFSVANNGVYYKTNKIGSSLYYSSKTKIEKVQFQKALRSEAMDISFKNIVDHNPNIVAAYFNSWDNMNRLYPFIDNVYEQYGDHINMEDYNFYYLANKAHNPEKQPVWTSAYLDPAGNGWMVSCVVPIYNKDFLEGVTGLDVTIESFVTNLLSRNFLWGSSVFMVDQNGMILAMPQKVEKILGLEELKKHIYTETITQTIKKPEEYNILKNENSLYTAQFNKLLKGKQDIAQITSDGKNYMVLQKNITATNWKLMILVEKEAVFSTINSLKKISDNAGYAAVVFIIIFYLIFFYYLTVRSNNLATQICKPLKELSNKTAIIGTKKIDGHIVNCNIEEIDQLNQNFHQMANELQNRTDKLIETKLENKLQKQEAKMYQAKSLTDPLTKLYNRLKMDEMMQKEIEFAKRYRRPFSIILLDIDNFKIINDTYGHAVGDAVLVNLAKILQNNIRNTDIVARIGGEEFIVICSNTKLDDAKMLAEKLRKLIESEVFISNYCVTASLGVAAYKDGDSQSDIFNNVDKALYDAKENGRNQIALYNL